QAAEVEVAAGLADGGLATEFGHDRLEGEAGRLLAAVPAALAHALVDDQAVVRSRRLAGFALAPKLRRTGLIVDEHGNAGQRGQLLLRRDHLCSIDHPHAGRQVDTAITAGVLGGDYDGADSFGREGAA